MEKTTKTISGKLSRKTFGKGSKSQYEAVYITDDNGSEFVLRRVGENPRQDLGLIEMVGKSVSVRGSVHDYLFLATEVIEID